GASELASATGACGASPSKPLEHAGATPNPTARRMCSKRRIAPAILAENPAPISAAEHFVDLHRALVVRPEHLGVQLHEAAAVLDGLVPGGQIEDREACDELLRLGERAVGHRELVASQRDA